jgi:T5SS/PEP-CTERM-associated repeat protein
MNWSGGIPNSSTSAQINNGGTATIGSTGAESCDLTLGFNATQSGRAVVDHGALDIQFDAAVATYGKGVLTITNGGTVTAALATIAALQNISGSASIGTVSVDGGSFTVGGGIYVGGDANGYGGTGLLTAINGATVTAANVRVWKSGTLTGNGTVITTNGTTIEGTLAPNGQLAINGDVSFSGTVATMECHVVPASADNVNVSGVASLAGKISVTMTGSTFRAGTTYTLLHAAGGFDPNHRRFDFNSIKGGSGDCFTPVITYDTNNNNVNLYLSPCSN